MHVVVTALFFLQYATDIQYQGIEVSVYISSFAEGNKTNNYTILVRKDNGNPVILHFVGYDRLFGSHYDEYVVEYTTFTSSTPDPSVFDYQESELIVLQLPFMMSLFFLCCTYVW